MTYFTRLLLVPLAALGAWSLVALTASAQSAEPAVVAAVPDAATIPLDLSLRTHDDWPLLGLDLSVSTDLSPRMHDDWPLHTS